MFYTILITLHSILRWLVVIAAVYALLRTLLGWLGRKEWQAADDKAGMFFGGMMDLQVLVGLLLYFLASPITLAALQNFGGAMSNGTARFFAVEHVLMMIIAMVLSHVGRAQSKKANGSAGKFKRAFVWYALAVLFLLVAIPWPFSAIARPWLRLGTLF